MVLSLLFIPFCDMRRISASLYNESRNQPLRERRKVMLEKCHKSDLRAGDLFVLRPPPPSPCHER